MNPFQILGVLPNASKMECKKAYKRLCLKYHPDSPTGDAQKFQQICKAYELTKKTTFKRAKLVHNTLFTYKFN